MPMLLTAEQEMLADSARAFLADKAPVAHLRALRDRNDPVGFCPELWREFARMGLSGILVPECHGGLGLGHVEAGIVLEQIGRNLSPSPFLATGVGAVVALRAGGSELAARWLPRIASGEITAAIAHEESARHHPDRVALQAERREGGFVLSGTKRFAVNGPAADLLLVTARTSGQMDDLSLFLVEGRPAGLEVEAERLVDSSIGARLTFADVAVGAECLVGAAGEGRAIIDAMFRALRVAAAAELIGVGRRALEMTVSYLKERRQFGRAIGEFQALQHRAAHLYAELEVARAAVFKAQQLLDADDPAAERAAGVAKGMACLASALAVQEGVQMHGGIGMTDEFDIGLYMKRQRVLAEFFGDTDFHADRLARLNGY